MPPPRRRAKRRTRARAPLEAFIDFRKPLVAAVQAQALGAGLMLAALADEVIAAEGAKLGMPEMKHGMPSPIGIAILAPRMGRRAAERLVQLGEPLGAAEAARAGLVDQVVAFEEVLKKAKEKAKTLGALSPRAFGINKAFTAPRRLRSEPFGSRRRTRR